MRNTEGIATRIDFLFVWNFTLRIEDLWSITFYVFKYKYNVDDEYYNILIADSNWITIH